MIGSFLLGLISFPLLLAFLVSCLVLRYVVALLLGLKQAQLCSLRSVSFIMSLIVLLLCLLLLAFLSLPLLSLLLVTLLFIMLLLLLVHLMLLISHLSLGLLGIIPNFRICTLLLLFTLALLLGPLASLLYLVGLLLILLLHLVSWVLTQVSLLSFALNLVLCVMGLYLLRIIYLWTICSALLCMCLRFRTVSSVYLIGCWIDPRMLFSLLLLGCLFSVLVSCLGFPLHLCLVSSGFGHLGTLLFFLLGSIGSIRCLLPLQAVLSGIMLIYIIILLRFVAFLGLQVPYLPQSCIMRSCIVAFFGIGCLLGSLRTSFLRHLPSCLSVVLVALALHLVYPSHLVVPVVLSPLSDLWLVGLTPQMIVGVLFLGYLSEICWLEIVLRSFS